MKFRTDLAVERIAEAGLEANGIHQKSVGKHLILRKS